MRIRQQPETQGNRAKRKTMRASLLGALLCTGLGSPDAQAGACSDSQYGGTDVDCAIILCLVGGFGPSECKPAYQCFWHRLTRCLLYTSPSPRDRTRSRMPSSA